MGAWSEKKGRRKLELYPRFTRNGVRLLYSPDTRPPPSLLHCARAMSAPASPSGSETSTIGFSIDNLLVELGGGSPLSVVGPPDPLGATGSALSAAASWLEQLNSGGPMPPRAELIGLLSGLLQAQVAPVLATTARAVPDLAANGLDEARLVLDPNVRAATGPNPTAP